jgi:16S rRNA (adenine1518-N6/adenine1519-N6)-dimethyltransferase
MFAKKSLGQHFLKSERALNVIVESGEINRGDVVLEIGPGLGALTEKLLAEEAEVLAVEKDDNLFTFLQEKFARDIEEGRLKLQHEDILNFDPNDLGRYKIIANIPYNLTGAIFEKFLSATNQPDKMILLVQKEVAERIVARDDKESILSISIKAYGDPKYIEKVLAGSFAPAPKVDSAIIAVENISKDFFKNFSEKEFFNLLHAGFKSKRKKLSSNLSTLSDKTRVAEAFSTLKLDPNIRAEKISVGVWQKLADELIGN